MRVVVVTNTEDVPLKPVDEKPTLVYWNIVGLVQPQRLALVMAGVDHVDVRIDAGDPKSDSHKQAWEQAKAKMLEDDACPMICPNLPYYIDGDVCLTQSDTILKYLGRKYDLMGDPSKEHILDLVLDELKDLEGGIARNCYGLGKEALASWLETDVVPIKLKQLNRLFKDKDSYLTGDRISVADLKLFTFLSKLELMQGDLESAKIANWLSDNPNLEAFMSRMKEVPALKSYMESPHYQTRPMNNPSAKITFGPK